MTKWVFINDNFVADEKANLHYSDLAIQRGYGVFDFLKVVHYIPFFLDEHLDRFFQSAEFMRLPCALFKNELRDIIRLLIKKNNIADCGIRITLTGGYSADGYRITRPNLIISTHLFQNSQKNRTEGIRLITYPYQRQFPEAKTIDYAMAIWLQPLISEKSADDVLYHQNQVITECPRSNIFFIRNDEKIATPASKILKGITRMKVLQAASQLFETQEGIITVGDLKNVKAAFITSTTKTILPVARIDGFLFDPFHPVINRLQESLLQLQSF